MRVRLIVGAALTVMLMGIGVLVGSVVGTSGVSAQAPVSSPTPSATNPSSAPSTTNPNNGTNPGNGPGFGGRHGGMPGGRGDFGMGKGMGGDFGFGRGMYGGDNAQAASAIISRTTSTINLVKSDLTYANGKMDTSNVQRWVIGAETLLSSAQSANSSSQYGAAVGYAQAAEQLAMVADNQMAQTLGADKLPSYSQRPQRGNKTGWPTATVTQAQASRVLASTYNELVMQGAVIKNASNTGSASTYLTDAQNAYKTAYDAYQAGKYNEAVQSAKLADQLAGVAGSIVRATTAPADSNTPVTVPAPNF